MKRQQGQHATKVPGQTKKYGSRNYMVSVLDSSIPPPITIFLVFLPN